MDQSLPEEDVSEAPHISSDSGEALSTSKVCQDEGTSEGSTSAIEVPGSIDESEGTGRCEFSDGNAELKDASSKEQGSEVKIGAASKSFQGKSGFIHSFVPVCIDALYVHNIGRMDDSTF